MMIAKKTLLASSVALATLGLVACGGGGGDSQDTSSADQTSFTGLVIDGRIANGFVWIDTDDDGAIDLYEPYAYTDGDGYYSYNPLTNTNYCADTSHQNCLNTGIVDGEAKIKIAGGTDLDSGESFQGVMVLKTSRAEAREQESLIQAISTAPTEKPDFIPMISPLTSLLSSIDESDYATMLNRVGVNTSSSSVSDLLKRDYSNLSDTTDLSLVKASYRVQKIVDSMAVILDERSNNREVNIGLTSSSSPSVTSSSEYVMQSLAARLKEGTLKNGTALSLDENALDEIVNSADTMSDLVSTSVDSFATKVANLDTEGKDSIKEKLSISNISGEMTTIVQQVKSTIDSKMGAVTTNDKNALKVAILGSETLVAKVKKEAENLAKVDSSSNTDASTNIQTIATKVADSSFDTVIKNNVVDAGKTLEVGILVDDLDGGENDITTAVGNSTLADAPTSGDAGIWATRVLSLSGVSTDGKEEKGRIMIFFGGSDNTQTEGSMSMCYAYNASKASEDIEAALFTGTWKEAISRGIVLVKSGVKDFKIKAVSQSTISDNEKSQFLGFGTSGDPGSSSYGKFRFESGDQQDIWYSDIAISNTSDKRDWGLVDSSSVPTTKEGCASFELNGISNALTKNLGF